VDCVISNCVINLAPDKSAVFREIFRVLKPGGRVALSDIGLKKPLPSEIGQDMMAYIGCVAGALPMGEYEQKLRAAGFDAVQVVDSGKDLNVYAEIIDQVGCCSPGPSGAGGGCLPGVTDMAGLHAALADLFRRYNINDFAASVQVYAVKGQV
jgi:SAM-dependent methyltransferase